MVTQLVLCNVNQIGGNYYYVFIYFGERGIERRLIKENLKTYFMEIDPKGLILNNGFPSGSISKESTCNIEGCL